MITRIRTTKNDSFQAATFELILHALLKGLGCTVTVEPEVPNESGKRPDFLVVTPQGDSVYVEATLAFADSPEERAMERRINGIYDALEKIDSPNFSVNVWVRATSVSGPSETKLRRHVVEWLATLDPDAVFQRVIATHCGSFSEYHDGEWIISLEAWGRPPERRGLGQRVVGMRHGNVGVKNDWGPIRKAIKKKGSRYDILPHPLLVAVNVYGFWLDRNDEMQALFGQEQVVFHKTDQGATPIVQRAPDGVWLGQFTRVSGTWIFDVVGPWTVARRDKHKPTVYFNPWAAKPLPSLFTTVHHAVASGNEMRWTEGLLPGDILHLPPDWP